MTRLEEITVIKAPMSRCFDLARSVEVHLLGNIHHGEQALAVGGVTSGLIGAGDTVTWLAKHFGIWHRLTSEITRFELPAYFQDTMRRGIFRSMCHDHFFHALSPEATQMRDVFEFAAPVPVAGLMVEHLLLRRYMQRLLRERNEVIRKVAESDDWRRYLCGS